MNSEENSRGQQPGQVMPVVTCRLVWGTANHQDESRDDWGKACYQKKVDLPFFPRSGDSLYLSQAGPFKVRDSFYDVDGGYAEVYIDESTFVFGDDWKSSNARLVSEGWELTDTEGNVPDLST